MVDDDDRRYIMRHSATRLNIVKSSFDRLNSTRHVKLQCQKRNLPSSPIRHLPRVALSQLSYAVWHHILYCCYTYHPVSCLDVLCGPSENLPD
jgi:hypothetical protein